MYVKVSRLEKSILMEMARSKPLWLSELVRRLKQQYRSEFVTRLKKQHGPVSKFVSSRRCERPWSRGGVEKALPRLQQKNLIEVVKTKETPSGVEQKWYDLTMRGLVVILSYKDSWNHIGKIAKKKAKNLPLVFGKWDYFGKKGVKPYVTTALRWAVEEPYTILYAFGPGKLGEKSSEIEKTLRKHLTDRVLFFSVDIASGWSLEYKFPYDVGRFAMESEEWVRLMIDDPDLKEYINRKLDYFNKRFEIYLEDIRLLKMLTAKAERPTPLKST